MFGFKPKLPCSDDERDWVDDGFDRLIRLLGRSRLLECALVEPSDKCFPEPYDGTERALETLFQRVCNYMQVDRTLIRLAVLGGAAEFKDLLPQYSTNSNDPAGFHFGRSKDGISHIAIRTSLIGDPLAAVATLAHELGHVILHDCEFSSDSEDVEPMTDLVTVFLGMGIFTANCARRFKQWEGDQKYGWSMKHLGYLPEVVYGYALARFAKDRGEIRPEWTEYLSTNLKTYFWQSAAWLERNSPPS
jgi:hypothetical protein